MEIHKFHPLRQHMCEHHSFSNSLKHQNEHNPTLSTLIHSLIPRNRHQWEEEYTHQSRLLLYEMSSILLLVIYPFFHKIKLMKLILKPTTFQQGQSWMKTFYDQICELYFYLPHMLHQNITEILLLPDRKIFQHSSSKFGK